MYPVAKNSREYQRRQNSYIDDLFERFQTSQNAVLFGAVPPELGPLLDAGLQELPFSEREAFVKAVQDAQAVLRDHCLRSAFTSGRAEYLAPPNVDELIDYRTHRIKINKESPL